MDGINIFSGEKGLGGALTNPTEMARRKGSITKRYAIQYDGIPYADVETAYQQLSSGVTDRDDELMVELIALKFIGHPDLMSEVTKRGGIAFLEACSHFTNAKTHGFQAWEGHGRQSRFIRNLISGYERALTGDLLSNKQQSLF